VHPGSGCGTVGHDGPRLLRWRKPPRRVLAERAPCAGRTRAVCWPKVRRPKYGYLGLFGRFRFRGSATAPERGRPAWRPRRPLPRTWPAARRTCRAPDRSGPRRPSTAARRRPSEVPPRSCRWASSWTPDFDACTEHLRSELSRGAPWSPWAWLPVNV